MPDKGDAGIHRCQAAAVICDADIGCPTVLYLTGDMLCPGVIGVSQQLLDDGRRALHHLTGSNQVSHMRGENIDNRHRLHLQIIELLNRI